MLKIFLTDIALAVILPRFKVHSTKHEPNFHFINHKIGLKNRKEEEGNVDPRWILSSLSVFLPWESEFFFFFLFLSLSEVLNRSK